MGRYTRLLVAAWIVLGTSAAAWAAPCAGFTDLDDSSPFCASVDWVKNQGITVGCGTGSTYCPNDPVTRLAMAAFLKRFNDAGSGQPYSYSMAPSCPFTNSCTATFPAVPAGKRLRLTNVRAMFLSTNATATLTVHVNLANSPLIAFTVAPFAGAYWGTLLSANQTVDLVFDAGQSPVLDFGSTSTIHSDTRNRLGVSGVLVSAAP
jgi:hypothetical protein